MLPFAKVFGTIFTGATIGAGLGPAVSPFFQGEQDELLPINQRKNAIDIAHGSSLNLRELFTGREKNKLKMDNRNLEEHIMQTRDAGLWNYYNSSIDYEMRKMGVTVKPQEMKETHMREVAKAMQHWGHSQNFSREYFISRNSTAKTDEKTKKLWRDTFNKQWGNVEKSDELWNKMSTVSGFGALALHVGAALPIPQLQLLKPIAFAADLAFGITMGKEAYSVSNIDRHQMVNSILLGAPVGYQLIRELKPTAKMTKLTANHVMGQMDEAISGTWGRSYNANNFDMNIGTAQVLDAAKLEINPVKKFFVSLGDYGAKIGAFNGLLAGTLLRREQSSIINNAWNLFRELPGGKKEYLHDIVYNRGRMQEILKKHHNGQELDMMEGLAAKYADFSFESKMANDVEQFLAQTKGARSGDYKAKMMFKRGETTPLSAEELAEIEGAGGAAKEKMISTVLETMDVDFEKLSTDATYRAATIKAMKRKMLAAGPDMQVADNAVIEVDVDVKTGKQKKGKEGMADETRKRSMVLGYEYPYAPLHEKGIFASIEEAGKTRMKFIPQSNIEDGLRELQSKGIRVNKIYPSENAMKTNLGPILKTVLNVTDEGFQEIMADGPTGLKEWLNQKAKDASFIRKWDIQKTGKEYETQHISQIPEELRPVLMANSINRSLIGPYNNKLVQLHELLNKVIIPGKENTLGAHMKRALDQIFDPVSFHAPELNKLLRSSWVAFNTPLLAANHIQSVMAGMLRASKEFGGTGVKDFLMAYGKAFSQGDTYANIAKGWKQYLATAPTKKNGYEAIRDLFYQLEPFEAVETQMVKNFIGKNSEYSKVFGITGAMDDVTAHAGRNALQFMGMLEAPFVELNNPQTVDLLTSFYRYMSRPVTSAVRAMTSRKGAIPSLLMMGAWAGAFGAKATPASILPAALDMFGYTFQDFVEGGEGENPGERLQSLVGDFFGGIREKLIPDEMIPYYLLGFGQYFKKEILEGRGEVGRLLREKTGASPSFTTLGFDPSVPHASPLFEMVYNFAKASVQLRGLKANYDSSPTGETEKNLTSFIQALTQTVGYVKRASEKPMASGYGVQVPDTPAKIAEAFFLPQRKYSIQEKQEAPISVKNIEMMTKMSRAPDSATETIFTSFMKDPDSRKLFFSNAKQLVSGLDQRMHKLAKEGGMLAGERAETLVKTLGMTLAWYSVGENGDPGKAANHYLSTLQRYGVKDTRRYLTYYWDIVDKSTYYKNTLSKVGEK